jgi:hypothetical protein
VNILNKQSRTAKIGWPTTLAVGHVAKNLPHHKKLYMLRSIYNRLGNGQILWHT